MNILQRMQKDRDDLAASIRKFRQIISEEDKCQLDGRPLGHRARNRLAREIATRSMPGWTTPSPPKPTLGHAWPVRQRTVKQVQDNEDTIRDITYLEAVSVDTQYGDSWRAVIMLDNEDVAAMDDYLICSMLDMYRYSGGPGRGFSSNPWVERGTHHTLVHQSGGLDI